MQQHLFCLSFASMHGLRDWIAVVAAFIRGVVFTVPIYVFHFITAPSQSFCSRFLCRAIPSRGCSASNSIPFAIYCQIIVADWQVLALFGSFRRRYRLVRRRIAPESETLVLSVKLRGPQQLSILDLRLPIAKTSAKNWSRPPRHHLQISIRMPHFH